LHAIITAFAIWRGFDPALYLEANPDVAMAGVDPVLHYVEFGKAENRRIRP
jgi:hypothetical protein